MTNCILQWNYKASSPGFTAVTLSIPVSSDPAASVLFVAEAVAGKLLQVYQAVAGKLLPVYQAVAGLSSCCRFIKLLPVYQAVAGLSRLLA